MTSCLIDFGLVRRQQWWPKRCPLSSAAGHNANPVKRRLEQSSDTVRRRSARINQTVQEHEQSSNSVRRRSACTNQAVQEHEQLANTVRRGIARDEPGVREHETEQRAAARDMPGVREHVVLLTECRCRYYFNMWFAED